MGIFFSSRSDDERPEREFRLRQHRYNYGERRQNIQNPYDAMEKYQAKRAPFAPMNFPMASSSELRGDFVPEDQLSQSLQTIAVAPRVPIRAQDQLSQSLQTIAVAPRNIRKVRSQQRPKVELVPSRIPSYTRASGGSNVLVPSWLEDPFAGLEFQSRSKPSSKKSKSKKVPSKPSSKPQKGRIKDLIAQFNQ
jgi:hypothetical protein